ncbi:Calcium-binding protein 8 [Tupaia chinensis]|uniref:Calcium-binding protein 8 n=1 Tax=Tupaia chinensis TaxID=246437 RepID=L9KES8_TUPCH|nr:Calcium-binding protein 8 [Tupaia chinensis]
MLAHLERIWNHIQRLPYVHWAVYVHDLGLADASEIREAFRVLDRDGNGFISKQELGMAMRSLGYMPSEVELAIIMQRLDMDGKTGQAASPRDEFLSHEPWFYQGLAFWIRKLGFMSWLTFEEGKSELSIDQGFFKPPVEVVLGPLKE